MFVIGYILRDILNDVMLTSQQQLESDMKNYKENTHTNTPESNE